MEVFVSAVDTNKVSHVSSTIVIAEWLSESPYLLRHLTLWPPVKALLKGYQFSSPMSRQQANSTAAAGLNQVAFSRLVG